MGCLREGSPDVTGGVKAKTTGRLETSDHPGSFEQVGWDKRGSPLCCRFPWRQQDGAHWCGALAGHLGLWLWPVVLLPGGMGF